MDLNSETARLPVEDMARHAGDAMLAISREGRVLRLNPVAENLFATTTEEAAGRPCREILGSDLCTRGCPLTRVVATGQSATHFNVSLSNCAAGATPVCILASPLRDESGEITGIVESIRDVTHVVRLIEEHEAAVAESRRATAWLGAIVDVMNDAVIATDANIRINSFNRMAELLTGYSREEVLGRSCKEVFSSGFCPLEETLRAGTGLPGMDLSIRAKDGRRIPVWITTELLRDRDNRVVGAVQLLRGRSSMVTGEPAERGGYAPLIGDSPAMQEVYQWIDRLAGTDSTVLLQGESGTGKELVAEALHFRSPRGNKPLIRVNCAALPETLLESELFGHSRGAFTGAVQDRPGRFELAHQGTLLLDEIGDLPLPLQAKLLRVLQERSVQRLGSSRSVNLDIRVIAATNRDVRALVAGGAFREDLYFRLAVVPLTLPPLRDHMEDIPALAANFLGTLAARRRDCPRTVSANALRILSRYRWPGNVRELENALEYASVRAFSPEIQPEDLPPWLHSRALVPNSERDEILSALRSAPSAAEAAEQLGISRATLFRHMKKHGISGGLAGSRQSQGEVSTDETAATPYLVKSIR
ncbi:MAG: sigma 54-interacting transcriptional regulator [Bryobacterales bacterium]|nr:sigma 54-interacting transcriptional regulator [Bryobacterales bacterium]